MKVEESINVGHWKVVEQRIKVEQCKEIGEWMKTEKYMKVEQWVNVGQWIERCRVNWMSNSVWNLYNEWKFNSKLKLNS